MPSKKSSACMWKETCWEENKETLWCFDSDMPTFDSKCRHILFFSEHYGKTEHFYHLINKGQIT